MPACLAFLLVVTVLATAPAVAEEDCPKHFANYGLFLQAKKSCGKEADYPFVELHAEIEAFRPRLAQAERERDAWRAEAEQGPAHRLKLGERSLETDEPAAQDKRGGSPGRRASAHKLRRTSASGGAIAGRR